jgi:polar amino acid transport system substrate-binding protein
MNQPVKRALGAALAVFAAAVLVTSATAASARHAGGTLTFCSDITYPPEEFYVGTKPAGSDIDIGNAVAKRMGRTAKFQNTGFDGIIAALLAKKCDAVISGMNDTASRRKQVGFIDYLSVGQSLMVKKGNPSHISGLASLSGKSVSVEVGTKTNPSPSEIPPSIDCPEKVFMYKSCPEEETA